MSYQTRGIYKRFHSDGGDTWYIDKRIKRFGRLCEPTGTADKEEAQRYLHHRMQEIRELMIYGIRPRRTFREAADKYLAENTDKKSIRRDAYALKDMDPFIGGEWLDCVHDGTS